MKSIAYLIRILKILGSIGNRYGNEVKWLFKFKKWFLS